VAVMAYGVLILNVLEPELEEQRELPMQKV
jgi:hypothetical protein